MTWEQVLIVHTEPPFPERKKERKRMKMSKTVRVLLLIFGLTCAVLLCSAVPFPPTPRAFAAPSVSRTEHVPPAAPLHISSSTSGYNIQNLKSGLCIGIAPNQVGFSPNTGYAGDWACNTNPDQLWHEGSCNSSDFCPLINGYNMCLGVRYASVQEGARIAAGPCNGNADQYWYVLSPSYNVVTNYNSGYVIGVQGGSTQNGAELIQWASNGNLDQLWCLC